MHAYVSNFNDCSMPTKAFVSSQRMNEMSGVSFLAVPCFLTTAVSVAIASSFQFLAALGSSAIRRLKCDMFPSLKPSINPLCCLNVSGSSWQLCDHAAPQD